MPRSIRTLAALAVCSTLIAATPDRAHALLGRDGIQLVGGSPEVVVACSDAAGGFYAVWKTGRNIVALRVGPGGQVAAGWPATGQVLVVGDISMSCHLGPPTRVMPDGFGGAIVRYSWDCFGGFHTPLFCRVNADGSIAWKDASFATGVAHSYLEWFPDGAGGLYGAWNDRQVGSGLEPLWVQRLGADGSPAWPEAMLAMADLAFAPSVTNDGSSGVVVAWPCHAMSLDSSSVNLWDYAIPSCAYPIPQVRADGSGGVYVVWSNGTTARAQRLTAGDVATGWPAGGVVVGPGMAQSIFSDPAGGVFVRFSGSLQRVTGEGAITAGWPAGGIGLPTSCDPVPDGDGGVYVPWSENPTGQIEGTDLFARHHLADASLAPGWLATGSPISLMPGNQGRPDAVPDAAGGFYAIWIGAGVFAQHVTAGETIPLDVPTPARDAGLAIAPPAPHPVRGTLACSIVLPSPGAARLEVFDLLGRRVASQSLDVAGPGARPVRMDARRWSPGVYSIRLTQAGRTASTRFVVAR